MATTPGAKMEAIVCLAAICAAAVGQASPTGQLFEPRHATANIVAGTDQLVSGQVNFTQESPQQPLVIRGSIWGLTAGLHGLHVHENGNLTSACSDAGAHFNPESTDHGAPSNLHDARHIADLGNVVADQGGVARFQLEDTLQTLFDGADTVLGRAMVIHALQDDLGLGGDAESKKTGNAGARVGCGLIELVSP